MHSYSLLGVSRLDPHPPNRPNHPIPTQFQPNTMLQLIGGRFSRPRIDVGGSSDGFSSAKLKPPNSTNVIYEIWPTLTRSSLDSRRSRPYLVRFSQIRPNPNRFRWFRCRFRWFRCRFDEFLQISTLFFFVQILVTFVGFSNFLHWPNRPKHHPNPKPTQLINTGGWFQVPLFST